MLGVSMRPPHGSIAENPTSSSTTYRTLGAPSGAWGWRYGSQSGTESRESMLMVPWNGLVMVRVLRYAGAPAADVERALLACHHDLEALLRIDEVVVVVLADVDLDPVDATS